jgi:hypothetical protein
MAVCGGCDMIGVAITRIAVLFLFTSNGRLAVSLWTNLALQRPSWCLLHISKQAVRTTLQYQSRFKTSSELARLLGFEFKYHEVSVHFY